MTTENSATVKIIANMTREYNDLLDKSNKKLKEYRDLLTDHKKLGNKFMFLKKRNETLMEVHEKTLKNEYNLTDKLKEQRLEIVEDLDSIVPKKGWWNDDMVLENIRELIDKWEGKK